MSPDSEWHGGSLVDEIAAVLRERIIEDRYPPGALLSARALAEELSVARGVVGEALRTLGREGLVYISRGGQGTRVAMPDRSVFLSTYEIREVIDGLAARLAAGHAGAAIEGRAREALEAQRGAAGAGDRLGYMRANVSFHATMIDGSGNPLLRKQMWLVRSTARSAVRLGLERAGQAIVEHETILAAVCRGERQRAEHAARAHVRTTITALERLSDSSRNGRRER